MATNNYYVEEDYWDEGYVQSGMTVNWGIKEIFVPVTELALVQTSPTVIYDYDLNTMRLDLKDLEDDVDGMSYVDTHSHNTATDVGGIELAHVLIIINAYTVTFENGFYAVNLKGANSNVGDRVNVNNVSIRTANSTGLATSSAIEYSEYGDVVTVDSINGLVGTSYPVGTKRSPVSNIQDAVLIAQSKGFDTLFIKTSLSLSAGDDVSNLYIKGRHIVQTVIHIDTEAVTDGCVISSATVTGVLDYGVILERCVIGDLNYVNGYLIKCSLKYGFITLGGNSQATFDDCISIVAGADTPTIDFNGTGNTLVMRNYSGGIKLTNKTGDSNVSIDLQSGQIVLDSTFGGAGSYRFAGAGRIKNLGTSAVYDDSGIVSGTVTVGSQGFVVVDLSSAYSGTTYPTGTIPYPVNNIADAMTLAQNDNISTFKGIGLLDITVPYTFTNARFIGISINQSSVEFGTNLTFDELTCEDMHISGTCTGSLDTYRCEHHELLNYTGQSWNGTYRNTSTFTCGTGEALLYAPSFVGNELAPVIFDLDSDDIIFAIAGGQGGVKIINLGVDDSCYIQMQGGSVELDVSCTGTIRLYGSATLINNATNAIVEDNMVSSADISEILHNTSHMDQQIYIDTELATNGDGSLRYPFNTVQDAVDHAEEYNIRMLVTYTDLTVPQNLKNFTVRGLGTPTIDTNGQNIDGCEFYHCKLRGDYTGSIIAHKCNLAFSFTLNGGFNDCRLGSTFTIPDGGTATIKDSSSFSSTGSPPTFDIGGVGTASLDIVGHNGGINILNCNQTTDVVKVILTVGKIIVDVSCNNGTANFGGIAEVINNGSIINYVDNTVKPSDIKDIHLAETGRRKSVGLVDTIYEEDLTTPRKSFDIIKNGSGEVIEITPI